MFPHMNSVVFGQVSFEVDILVENNHKTPLPRFLRTKNAKARR